MKCVWEHEGALKVAFSANKSSSLIIIGKELKNVNICLLWCGRTTSFVQILISLPAGISLSFSRETKKKFLLFVCFVFLFRRSEQRTKNTAKRACVTCVQFSPLIKYYISLRDTLHRKVFKNTRREKKQTHLYILEQRSSGT